MFADPTSITINAVAESFATISRDTNKSVYRTADNEFTLTISRSESGNGANPRRRYLVRIDQQKIAADPVSSDNAEVTMSVYTVMDVPEWGYSSTQIDDVLQGLQSFLTTANSAKVLAGET